MFVNLETFISEKALYIRRINELQSTITNPEELVKLLDAEKNMFKSLTRRYLPTALTVIKNTFKCDYSLYKIGRDVDANFHTIETHVNKTKTEIINELNQFVQQANSMGLSIEQANKLNLAIDVIMNYVDDNAVSEDESKAFYLNHSKVVASSLDLPVTNRALEQDNNSKIQYNPYANQPIDFNSQTNQVNSAAMGNGNTYQSQVLARPIIQPSQPSALAGVDALTAVRTTNDTITDRNNDESTVGGEDNCVVAQFICAILIPVLAAIGSLMMYFVFDIDIIEKMIGKLPGEWSQILVGGVLVGVGFVLSKLIIKIAQNRTAYLERFVIAPILLSLPISALLFKLVSKMEFSSLETSVKVSAIALIAVLVFLSLCFFILIRAFVKGDQQKVGKAPAWSIFDGLGLLLVVYTTTIPALFVMIRMFGVGLIDDVIVTIYFLDNVSVSQYLDKIFFVSTPIIAILGMITRTIKQKRNSK